MVGSQQCLMISLTLILCLVPTVQHPQSICQGRGRHPDHHHAEDRAEGEGHQGH